MISTGGHLTILESVDSTNNYAMAQVRTGLAKHGDGFFAMAQVNGKGQRGKTWVTEPGTNIILTLLMHTSALALTKQFPFSTAIALAVHDFFSAYAGEGTSIKWPNDIYWRDRKAGGILIENIVSIGSGVDSRESVVNSQGEVDSRESVVDSQGTGQPLAGTPDEAKALPTPDYRLPTSWPWAIAGMGININQTVFPEGINAVSLKQITGKERDAIVLAKELCGNVQNRYAELLAGNDLLQPYNERLYKRGQTVKFRKGSRVFEGLVKQVNAQGELVIQTATEECFGFGEVEWVF